MFFFWPFFEKSTERECACALLCPLAFFQAALRSAAFLSVAAAPKKRTRREGGMGKSFPHAGSGAEPRSSLFHLFLFLFFVQPEEAENTGQFFGTCVGDLYAALRPLLALEGEVGGKRREGG